MLRTVAPGRSCAACKRRKIRCNRQQPCSYCAKLKGRCVYPAEARVAMRRSGDGGAGAGSAGGGNGDDGDEGDGNDVRSRLGRIEELLQEMRRAGQRAGAGNGAMESTERASASEGRISVEIDVTTGGRGDRSNATASGLPPQSDEGFWAGMRSTIGNSSTTTRQPQQHPLLEPTSANTTTQLPLPTHLAPYLPLPERILPLWLIYLDSVAPLLPILDTQTTQHQLLAFTSRLAPNTPTPTAISFHPFTPSHTSPHPPSTNLPAQPIPLPLLFSLMHAATTSLLSSTTPQHLPRTELRASLRKYAQGLDATLGLSLLPSTVSLLTNPTLQGLQALVLYIFSARVYRPAGVVWSLVGVARSVAVRLGLRRGGEGEKGMGEVEGIKERLWCAIVLLDTWTVGDVDADPGVLGYEVGEKLGEGMGGEEMLFLRRAMELVRQARRVMFSEGFMRANGYEVLGPEGRLRKVRESRERLRREDEEEIVDMDSDPNVGLRLFVRKWTETELNRMEISLDLKAHGHNWLGSAREILRGLADMKADKVMKKYLWLVLRDCEWGAIVIVLREALTGAFVDDETWELVREAAIRWDSFVKSGMDNRSGQTGGEVDEGLAGLIELAMDVANRKGRRPADE